MDCCAVGVKIGCSKAHHAGVTGTQLRLQREFNTHATENLNDSDEYFHFPCE